MSKVFSLMCVGLSFLTFPQMLQVTSIQLQTKAQAHIDALARVAPTSMSAWAGVVFLLCFALLCFAWRALPLSVCVADHVLLSEFHAIKKEIEKQKQKSQDRHIKTIKNHLKNISKTLLILTFPSKSRSDDFARQPTPCSDPMIQNITKAWVLYCFANSGSKPITKAVVL